MTALIAGAVEVKGDLAPDIKADRLTDFGEGSFRVLVSKPEIAGFGLNYQHCARMVFVGLGDSFEKYYQSIRRCWRFGQTRPVNVYIVLTDLEEPIYANVLRKEREAESMGVSLVRHIATFEKSELDGMNHSDPYDPRIPMRLPAWMTEINS